MLEIDFEIPNLILNRYQVLRELGRGTSGVVLLCSDLRIGGRPVALKIYSQSVVCDRQRAVRIQRELLTAFKIEHDNVVRFYDLIKEHAYFGFTMEYIDGPTLESVAIKRSRLQPWEVVRILLQLCRGVSAIHKLGVAHRDLKPANILLTSDGIVKIGDLGLVKEAEPSHLFEEFGAVALRNSSSERASVTNEGEVPGTLAFMSPEYLQFGKFDIRGDIYALGTIGYELLCGSIPFDAPNTIDYVLRKITNEAPAVTQALPDCPADLARVISHAMARDPSQRFQSAAAMEQALRGCHWAEQQALIAITPEREHGTAPVEVAQFTSQPRPIINLGGPWWGPLLLLLWACACVLATIYLPALIKARDGAPLRIESPLDRRERYRFFTPRSPSEEKNLLRALTGRTA